MNKTLLSLAIMGVIALTSCTGNAGSESQAPAQDSAATTEAVNAEPQQAQPASLADIVDKAKTDGANWTTEEWKSQFKAALEAYKPFAVAMNNPQEADLEKIKNEFGDYPALIKEFATIANQSEGGKAIDDEWIQNTMQELGVPHL